MDQNEYRCGAITNCDAFLCTQESHLKKNAEDHSASFLREIKITKVTKNDE